jgi:hypothetical protein
MKQAFRKELKLMIENEIKEQHKEEKQTEKLINYSIRMKKIDDENKMLQEAK